MKRRHQEIDNSQSPIFVTTAIVEWIPVFAEKYLAEGCLRTIEESRRWTGISVMAFALMPNHFHGMIVSKQSSDLSKFMLIWKSLTARLILNYSQKNKYRWLRQFNRSAIEHKCTGRQAHQVWIPRFDALPVENDGQFYAGLNYIHFNPVKHLLVRKSGDYPYSSFHDYQGGRNGFVTVNRHLWDPRSGQP
jgi:putative transposase